MAKRFLKESSRGNERYGIVGSSDARRLKAEGLNVKDGIEVEHWFLSGKDDVRSSFYMEDIATEFDIQGLELDWVCVAWGGDFRYTDSGWEYKSFKGRSWQNINREYQKLYKKNSYRVLLTRARQGMVIFVPEGSIEDYTRNPEYYDGTYNYLRSVGIEELGEEYFENLGIIQKKIHLPDDLIKGKEETMKYLDLDTQKSKNNSLKSEYTRKKNGTNDNKLKIGQLVRESMENISKLHLLKDEYIYKLMEEEYSKKTFNLNYPFMKKIDITKDLKEQRLVNNYPRYWAKVFIFNGEEYYICSEWYEDANRDFFEKWRDKILNNTK